MRYSFVLFFFLFLGFGFRREGSWVAWKRKVLGLEEKSFSTRKRRKKEEGRRKTKKKKIVLTFNAVCLRG